MLRWQQFLMNEAKNAVLAAFVLEMAYMRSAPWGKGTRFMNMT
jgi:hypothetical protein